jgi:hypothetical protein
VAKGVDADPRGKVINSLPENLPPVLEHFAATTMRPSVGPFRTGEELLNPGRGRNAQALEVLTSRQEITA